MKNRVIITAMAMLATFAQVAVMIGFLYSWGNVATMSYAVAAQQSQVEARI